MVSDYYTSLNYYARVSTTRATGGKNYTYPTATAFQGLIDKSLSTIERVMGGQNGTVIDARMFYDINTTIPHTAIISDGTDKYKIIGRPIDPTDRGSHYEVLLQYTSTENL